MLAGALVIYLILQFGIAWVASRTIKVEADYFLAGRKLGVFAIAMSVFATWFGAESVMGSSGARCRRPRGRTRSTRLAIRSACSRWRPSSLTRCAKLASSPSSTSSASVSAKPLTGLRHF